MSFILPQPYFVNDSKDNVFLNENKNTRLNLVKSLPEPMLRIEPLRTTVSEEWKYIYFFKKIPMKISFPNGRHFVQGLGIQKSVR